MKKRNVFTLLAVILIFAIFVVFIYIIKSDNIIPESNISDTITNTIHTDTNMSTGIPMSSYKNDEYGFNLQYPEIATVSVGEFASNVGSIYIVQPGDPRFDQSEEYTLAVNVGATEEKTLEEFYKYNKSTTGIPTVVAGVEALRAESIGDNSLYIGTFFIGEQGNYYHFYIEIFPPSLAGEVIGTHTQEYLNSVKDTYSTIIESFEFVN